MVHTALQVIQIDFMHLYAVHIFVLAMSAISIRHHLKTCPSGVSLINTTLILAVNSFVHLFNE